MNTALVGATAGVGTIKCWNFVCKRPLKRANLLATKVVSTPSPSHKHSTILGDTLHRVKLVPRCTSRLNRKRKHTHHNQDHNTIGTHFMIFELAHGPLWPFADPNKYIRRGAHRKTANQTLRQHFPWTYLLHAHHISCFPFAASGPPPLGTVQGRGREGRFRANGSCHQNCFQPCFFYSIRANMMLHPPGACNPPPPWVGPWNCEGPCSPPPPHVRRPPGGGGVHNTMVALKVQQPQYSLKKNFIRRGGIATFTRPQLAPCCVSVGQ